MKNDAPKYHRGPPTAATRAKISRALRGRPHSPARRLKMHRARLAYLRRLREEKL